MNVNIRKMLFEVAILSIVFLMFGMFLLQNEYALACEGSITKICSILGNDPKPSILDQDIFKFYGTKGERVTIHLGINPSGSHTGERATLILIDNIKRRWFFREDRGTLDNEIRAVLPATGEYQIFVNEQPKFLPGRSFMGAYCFTLHSSKEAWSTFEATSWVEPDASSVIGPEGGIIEVTDPNSPIYGEKLNIPQGALSENVNITISSIVEDTLQILPSGSYFLGGLELGPDGLYFNLPISVTISLNTQYPEGTLVPIFFYDLSENQYIFETEGKVIASGDKVEALINHFSKHIAAGQSANSDDQTKMKNEIISSISDFLKQYEGRCFYDKGFLSLGNISKVSNRINDSDVQIFTEPDYLDKCGAEAAYVDLCYIYDTVCQTFCPRLLFNDLVLSDEPQKAEPQTVYHEIMHAIFDKYDGELKNKGIPNDEAITWYMETVVNNINMLLIPVEEELEKAKRGEPYDLDGIKQRLDLFVQAINDYKEDPGEIAGSGTGSLPSITSEGLDFVKDITGLFLNPEDIRQRYLSGECGSGPTPNASTWAKTYSRGSLTDSKFWSVTSTKDEGSIATGYTWDSSSGAKMWVVRLNKYGDILWQKTYYHDFFYTIGNLHIDQTKDGNYILLSANSVLKLAENGDVMWLKLFSDLPSWEPLNHIRKASDGGFILCTRTFVLKIDQEGNFQWGKQYKETRYGYGAEITSIEEVSDGRYVLSGIFYNPSGERGGLIIEIDSQGSIIWQKTYTRNAPSYILSVENTSDNGYIAVGRAWYPLAEYPDYEQWIWVLRLDSNGEIIWQKGYGGTYGESGWANAVYDIKQTIDGGFITVGGTAYQIVPNGWAWDGLILKLKSDGSFDWQKFYGRHWNGRYGGDIAQSIYQTTDSGYLISLNDGFIFGEPNIPPPLLLKLDNKGNIGDACEVIRPANLTLRETDAIPTNSYLIDLNAIFEVIDIDVITQDTNATTTVQCSSQ